MREQRRKVVVADLVEELVLAAGHREDHLRLPPDGPFECGVGRGVARVQRHDDVGRLALEERNVADVEPEAVIPQ